MKLVFTDDEGVTTDYLFDPAKLMSPETEAIERLGRDGWWETFEEFGVLFMKGNSRARRVALWVCMKRAKPGVRFDDVSISMATLFVDFDNAEKVLIREALATSDDIAPSEKARMLETIDAELLAGGTPLAEQSPNSDTDVSTSSTVA